MKTNKLSTKDEKILSEIIHSCLTHKSIEFDKSNFIIDQLEYQECIVKTDIEKQYQLITGSEHVLKVILSIVQEKLSKKLPSNVSDAILFCDEVQKILEQPRNNVTWAGLIELISNLKMYVLVVLNQQHKIDVIEYYLSMSDKSMRDSDHHLSHFEKPFFMALPQLTSNVERIKQVMFNCLEKSARSSHSLIDFCRSVGEKHPLLAKQLLEIEGLVTQSTIGGHIMAGLYKNDAQIALQFAERYNSTFSLQSILFFGRINFQSLEHMTRAIELAESIDVSNFNLARSTIDIFVNILDNEHTTPVFINRCFNNFERLLDSNNEDLRNELAWFFSIRIKGFEEHRYMFLHKFLNKGHDPTIIRNYFNHFENPKYFFHFFMLTFNQLGTQLDLGYFEGGLRHFWAQSPKETEMHLLDIISHQNRVFRIVGLRLMHHTFSHFNHINVLFLDTAEKQLRTLEGLVGFPFGIDSTVSVLLLFRKSKHKQVVRELQSQLSILVLESYQDYLFELIEKALSKTKKDLAFLAPIKDALEIYHQIKEMKAEVNDLNPVENEKDLMNLYFEMEYEKRAKMMESVRSGKGTFLEHFGKSSIIVRGNSWKLDGKDEIRPLGHYSHSVVLDSKIFKNPDWYENQLNKLTQIN